MVSVNNRLSFFWRLRVVRVACIQPVARRRRSGARFCEHDERPRKPGRRPSIFNARSTSWIGLATLARSGRKPPSGRGSRSPRTGKRRKSCCATRANCARRFLRPGWRSLNKAAPAEVDLETLKGLAARSFGQAGLRPRSGGRLCVRFLRGAAGDCRARADRLVRARSAGEGKVRASQAMCRMRLAVSRS